MGGWDFHDISAVHPGNTTTCSGKVAANIGVIGGIRALHFSGVTYMEGPAGGTCGDAIQLSTGASEGGAAIDFDSVQHGAYCSGTSAYLFSVPGSYTLGHLGVLSTSTGNFTNLFKYTPNTTLNVSGVGTATTYPHLEMDNNNPSTVLTNFQVVGTTALGTATATTAAAGDNSTRLATTAYVRNEAQFAWTCPVAGATTTGVSYCNWTVPANLSITQFDLAASTAPAGCTTYPTLQVWDGKANAQVGSYSISMTSGNNFYNVVTGSTNLAQGEYLRIKVTTGGSGCTTTPAGIVATVTYQMEN
jgi:hypothetical protein